MSQILYKAKKLQKHYFGLLREVFLKRPSPTQQHLIDDLRAEMKVFDKNMSQTTDSWTKYQKQLAKTILARDPRNFLSWDIISSSMYFNPPSVEYTSLLNLNNSVQWEQAIQEDKIGYPPKYKLYKKSSGNLIHHAYALSRVTEKFNIDVKQIKNVFEFGGGYGSFCRMMFKYGYDSNYFIYDLPLFSNLQNYFLKSVNIQLKISALVPSQDATINNNQVYLFSGNIDEYKNVTDNETDLFVALWSLSESPLELRDQVLGKLSNIKYFLIGYQEDFHGIDNVAYFENMRNKMQNYEWFDYQINHIKGNRYMLGKRLSDKAK